MSTTTTNYGLIKPDITDPILIGQLNDNADTIDATMKSISDALDVAKLGIKYKGEVYYYSDLPSTGNQIGDAYTVKYSGTSGTTPDGTEYVWGTISGTNQWINFSKDSYTKAEVDALLALKQNALTTAQLAAVNSGIDSEKVSQIETNKNNILFNARNGVVNMTNISDITLSSDGYLANKVNFNAAAGTYRLKSIISGGTAKYTVVARMGNTEVYRDDTTIGAPNIDHIFTLSTAADSISIWVQLQSETPVAISNTMVYPAALGDTPYQPYAMSNAELTAVIQAIQAQLANQ